MHTTRDEDIHFNEFVKDEVRMLGAVYAFYIFPSIKEFGMTSKIRNAVSEEEKVAVVPKCAW